MFAMFSRIDPMVRLLVLATVLASIFPATGDWRAAAQVAASIAVFVLFFLNGVRLARADVVAASRNLRVLIPLIAWCFIAMAFAGYGLFRVSDSTLPGLIALGFIYLGVLPSTVQSATSYTSLAGGNVSLAIVAAATLNIIGVFVSAPLFSLLGGAQSAFDLSNLGKVVLLLLVPFALGQLVQSRLQGWVAAKPTLVKTLDRTAIAMAAYVALSGAVEQGLWTRLGSADWIVLLGCLSALMAFGYAGSWMTGGVLRFARGDRIAFTFSGAQKSVAMGAPLGLVLFGAEKAGLLLVPLIVYHLMQLLVAAPLAARFARGNPD